MVTGCFWMMKGSGRVMAGGGRTLEKLLILAGRNTLTGGGEELTTIKVVNCSGAEPPAVKDKAGKVEESLTIKHKDFLYRHPENPGNIMSQLQRGVILVLLEEDNRFTPDINLLCQLILGEVMPCPVLPDTVIHYGCLLV